MPARMILATLVALSLLTACAQESWESYNDAGEEAVRQVRYTQRPAPGVTNWKE